MYANTPEVKDIALKAFPEYSGKRFQVEIFHSMSLASYWSGGSRDYFQLIKLDTLQTVPIPENGSGFNGEAIKCEVLPENTALIQWTRGPYEFVKIYLRPENMTKMLPAPVELTREERIVLCATRSLKSSYGGVKNYRFQEANSYTGITELAYNEAKAGLVARKMLNGAGAITDDGRNAIGNVSLFELGRK